MRHSRESWPVALTISVSQGGALSQQRHASLLKKTTEQTDNRCAAT
jgi:hypothetical protein